MYLEQVHIKNLLSFKDALLSLAKYNVIVGPNNSGKTNFLRILYMIAKNERIDSFQLKRRLKLDPEKPTEITLRVRMEENESSMIFQCIFGTEEVGAKIHELARTMDVTVVWDEAAQSTLLPKFTMFRFDNGFTIILTSTGNVAFDSLSCPNDEPEQSISAWRSKNNYVDLEKFIGKRESSRYPVLEDKSRLISSAVNQQSNIMEVLGSYVFTSCLIPFTQG